MGKKQKAEAPSDKQEASTTQQEGQAAVENTALFFERPVPVDKNRHKDASCSPTQDFSFTADTNSIPVSVTEFLEVAKHYPIVFTDAEEPLPVAIVGLEQKNYFVDEKGSWRTDCYLPAYVRKYPFIFMHVPEKDQLVLCVDEASSQFSMKGREGALPLFTDGKPSETAQAALEFCTAFHNHHHATKEFCNGLKAEGLLVPNASTAKLFNGRSIRLGGFQVIDEDKFRELPDEKLLELRKKGWLPFIYFSMMAMSNWKRVVDMAGALEKENPAQKPVH